MLEYEELKQAVDNGFIQGETVMIVRMDGKIFDYVFSGEAVRPWELSFLKYRNNLYYILDFLLTLLMRFPSFLQALLFFLVLKTLLNQPF